MLYFEKRSVDNYNVGQSQFHEGNGEDCHRTWEAVLLGSIPIVRSSGIENLYQDAPIYVLGKGSPGSLRYF